MTSVHIRGAVLSDLEDVNRIRNACITELGEEFSEAGMIELLNSGASGACLLVAEFQYNQETVGYIYSSGYGTVRNMQKSDRTLFRRLEITEIAVSESYRRNGVAKRLLEMIEGMASEAGYALIRAVTRESAIPFWMNAGFQCSAGNEGVITLENHPITSWSATVPDKAIKAGSEYRLQVIKILDRQKIQLAMTFPFVAGKDVDEQAIGYLISCLRAEASSFARPNGNARAALANRLNMSLGYAETKKILNSMRHVDGN